jgi:DNA-binding response OmpR family regulator
VRSGMLGRRRSQDRPAKRRFVCMDHDRSHEQLRSSKSRGRPYDRLRVAVVDRDPGFMQVLVKRLGMIGADYRELSSPVSTNALVRMRLNALVVDVGVIGPLAWDYLEQTCSRLPGLAVVVCTGPSSVAQRVRGLRMGADAWLTKPCHPEEVVCVIEAAVRRHRRRELPRLDAGTVVGELTVRPDRHEVYVNGQSAQLTVREFEILQLLSQSDRVLRREEIYERVWGYALAHGDRSVDVFVRRLRQKLQTASPRWNYIHTHFGVGYRFAPELLDEPEPHATQGAREQADPTGEGTQLDAAITC